MIGKTNSIVVKGGDTPTPATVDKYKGLRPSYWPTIKMPDEFPNDNYIHTQLLLWIPAQITSKQQDVQLFNYTGQITDIIEVKWGDGSSSSSPYVENSHLYTTYTSSDAPQGSFYVVEITSTAIPTYYNGEYSDYYKYEILEMSCRCNIEKQYGIIDNLSITYATPYIRFISIHSKDGKITFQSEFPSLLLYPYMKSSTNGGLITPVTDVNLIGGSLIEIPDIYSVGVNLIIGSGKYTSFSGRDAETGLVLYNSIDIRTSKNENGYINSSALDVLPIPDVGTLYNSIIVQPNNSPLECLAIADLSQLSVNYQSGGQENYGSSIWGLNRGCVFSPKISIDTNDTSAKGIFRDCKNLQEATIVSWGGLSDEDGLQNAFYNCNKLKIVHMPENSLKVSIDLSSITSSSDNYIDPETGNSYPSTGDFLIQTVAKGLYDFTSAGETPSYTPTLTLSSYIKSYAESIYIDGTQFLEYITNKGWTLAEA